MADKNKYVELNNGLKMPLIGYGTFQGDKEHVLHENIVYAVVEWGYRHIDTAKVYDTEKVIGDALQECFEKGIKREDLFITTKLWIEWVDDPERELKASLEKLQLEYVDLFLIHWMITDVDWENCVVKGPPLHEIWKNMENLVELGLTKSIGISNCGAQLFIDMLASSKIKPVTNQIENNPYLQQTQLVKMMAKFGWVTTGYSPIGATGFSGGNMLEDEVIKEIADKHNATPAQIALAWNMNRGVVVIPKSMNKERIQQNFEALDIQLDEDDIAKIETLDQNKRIFDPSKWSSARWKNAPYFA